MAYKTRLGTLRLSEHELGIFNEKPIIQCFIYYFEIKSLLVLKPINLKMHTIPSVTSVLIEDKAFPGYNFAN